MDLTAAGHEIFKLASTHPMGTLAAGVLAVVVGVERSLKHKQNKADEALIAESDARLPVVKTVKLPGSKPLEL